jgi:putative ABC transport system permease protein
MLFKTSLRIIVHEKEKFAGAVAGVTIATFLMILQCGFYLGYDRDITVVLDSVDADLWVIPKNQPLFDGWDAMDDLPYYEMKENAAIARVARLVWGYAPFRLPAAGGRDTVEVLGVELESGIGLKVDVGLDDPAAQLAPDGHIVVARKDCEKLGVTALGVDGIEIRGRKATVVGLAEDVHLFTTAGFVMTDLDNGRAFLRVPEEHASYIVAKCAPEADVDQVVHDLQRAFPEHDVMSTPTFHEKANRYWSTRTGIGPVLMLSAGLAILVGFMIVMLAFYISTVDKLPVFACMKALGASGLEVVSILVFQVIIVFVLGCALAGAGIQVATSLLARTTISVVITRELILAGLGTTALCSALSSLLSIRQVINTDPGEAFRT